MKRLLFFVFSFSLLFSAERVSLGIDLFFEEGHVSLLKNKRVGLLTNHTGYNSQLESTVDLFEKHAKEFSLVAFFCPEHGLDGVSYAGEQVHSAKTPRGVPIYSLHGKTRRPTEEMLGKVDVIVFDIQDIGSRTYTYITTLFYMMEEAAKKGIKVIVLDRPNPINGLTVDGPMLELAHRSFIGYINIPYCHGMTAGELARLFNDIHKVGCDLTVIPMKGWKREMSFKDTGLHWIPTSPNIPEADTPFFYASTGILGELGLVSIGIGYTLPFKVVGAPWIKGEEFAAFLNAQKLTGVTFIPCVFRPFSGMYAGQNCNGVRIVITDTLLYRPLSTQYALIGGLKSLYTDKVKKALDTMDKQKRATFCKVNGNADMLHWLQHEKYIMWKMIEHGKAEREAFIKSREKYLLYPSS